MGNCTGRNIQLDPGSVLDRVISQASNDDDCLLYKLANYKKGGELIDAYGIGGAHEVEKLIREQFGILMYKDGLGQVISRTEYLRWKFRNIKQVVIPVEPTSVTDPLGKWEDHEACWQMQYRGSLGETLLHVLIICDTRLHTRLARILVKCFPKVALDVFEGEEYLGASALHLAIAYNNNELVHLLVEAGAAVEQRAIGSFFLPKDQQRVIPSKQTDYEGLAYLGEYPLSWAACVGNESVYNLLVDKGAHPDWQDTFGNMILHMVVVTDQLGMYGYALRHPRIVASNGIMNSQGLTPLTLACRLGRASVFREMLELSCREFWRYSNVTCSAYPLNALDTIAPDGRTNWNSALFMILAGSKEDHLNMLDGGIIQRLLEEKWKTFAQRQFLKRITIAFVHLLAMSCAIYTRPDDRTASLSTYNDVRSLFRLGFEIGTILNCISYVVFQQGEEIKNQGFLSFIKQLPHAPPKAVFLVANFIILSCIPFRMTGDIETEEALLTFAMVGSWFFMIFFAGAIKLTGPFITMIFSMITGDMLTFGIIYLIFLLAFSQAFYYLYKSHPTVNELLFVDYHSTWMAMYQMTLGQYSYSDLALTAYPTMSKGVFITFMILVPILLLNMLIAMMGNTYSQVIERSEKEWVKQWAKLVVTLERAVSQDLAKQHLEEYSIRLGGSGVDELRGVMVIKTKSKTRANQRKGAVSNWKRVGKVTITALKKRGMTGEEMRILMWGHRTSISTPQAMTPRQQSMDMDPAFVITNTNTGAKTITPGIATEPSLLNSSAGDLGTRDGSPVPSNLFGCFDDSVSQQAYGPPISPMVNITGETSFVKPHASVSPPLLTSLPTQKGSRKMQAQMPSTSAQAQHDEKRYLSMLEGSIPVVIPKVKRRNITTGLRPKIIIFSDKKDMIRVSLDSDESDRDFSDVPPASSYSSRVKMKSARRQSIAGDSLTRESSRESLCGDTDVEETPLAAGFVNRAFELDEPPEYSAIVQEPMEEQKESEVKIRFETPDDEPSTSKREDKLNPEAASGGAKHKRPKSAKSRENKETATTDPAAAVSVQKEASAIEPKQEAPRQKRKERASSALAGGGKRDRGSSSGPKQEAIPEERRTRPRTAFDQTSTRDISSMNKLVAWDRPEDDI